MRNRMLRSVLVAAFSAVVAFGTLAGLSGAESDAHHVGSNQTLVVVDDAPLAFPADSTWD
ncbi:hypothetical protein HTV45_15385 [Streptomyces sp. CHD11]|uniref:hypothetical protein n=1 Tax=Streptomyces sp. CHD11 TaxID=2741325 RepID=UPI001BFC3678|nr:hypothetical protein [Streptomyces sp. CHD11]MBT3152250.1 hypothetical protein [Streptomyces sp. CHD11]